MRSTFNIKEPNKNKDSLILFSAYFKNEDANLSTQQEKKYILTNGILKIGNLKTSTVEQIRQIGIGLLSVN